MAFDIAVYFLRNYAVDFNINVIFDRRKKTPNLSTGRFCCRSLTMTYFHTGTRTIIGAEAFHCPVRDGKEWDHLAMVIRHNLLLC